VPTVLRIVTRLNRGGPLRQLAALVPGLARRGWTGPVAFGQVASGEGDGRGLLAGSDLRRIPELARGIDPWRDLCALRAIVRLAREVRPDLIHTHTGKAGALGRLAGRRLGVPVVHTLHGHHFDAGGRTGRWALRAERWLGRLTTQLVVLSPRQRRDVVEVHQVVDAERTTIIGPGLDLEAYRRAARAAPCAPDPAGARSVGWLCGGPPTYLWAGRLVHVKQPQLVLGALEHARRPWRVLLLGGGPLRASLARRIRRRGLGERLALVGDVADTAPWLAAAHGLLLTSRSEGTPLSVLEAFALGRPVVVPTVGGLPDLVAHHVEGLWVPPSDPVALAAALDRLAGDPVLHARLAAGAAAAAARYDGDQLAARTAALYEQVLRGGPGRPGETRARAAAGAADPLPVASIR
jgi:glycosyltransferase involved in cell wall biosynthesis